MLDIVIVGAGPAGLFAAFYAGLRKLKGALIDSSSKPGGQLNLYLEKIIRDLPGTKEITAAQLKQNLMDQYKQFAADIPLYLNEQIVDIITHADKTFTIRTLTNQFQTKTVLIASGTGRFIPRKLEVPGVELVGNIVYSIKDLNRYRDRKVVILGGGDSALDWALAMEKVAIDTSIIHRRNEFRGHEDSIHQLQQSSVNILTPFVVSRVEPEQNGSTLLLLNLSDGSERRIYADDIIVNFGSIPSGLGALAKLNLDLTKSSSIAVNSDQSTNIPGVFAIGNAVDYLGKVTTLACAFGEVPKAINEINKYLNPGKNLPFIYSSMQK